MRTRLPVVPLIGIAIVVAQGCSSTSNDLGTGSPAPGGPNEGFGGGGVDASSGGVGFFGDGASGPIDVDAASLVARPTFPPTVTAAVPPPPISGGTLLVTHDGTHAIVSDPDRDLVYGVDLSAFHVTFTVTLQPGDEPGRVTEDSNGYAYVALRRGGALVTLDEATGAVVSRQNVCPAPRGVGWDASTNLVWVACATGELVSLTGGGGAVVQTVQVERDLRDIVVQGGAVTVTQMRTAQVLRVDGTGTVQRRDSLQAMAGSASHVVWRAIAGASGSLVVAYQNESTSNVSTQVQGGYGGGGFGG